MPTFETARAPLTQVVQNLISNAIKHHDRPANGHVWIEALTLPHAIEFTVTDDGPGIPERCRHSGIVNVRYWRKADIGLVGGD